MVPSPRSPPSPDPHQCCRIGRTWHVSRKDSFRYCGEHFLLKTSLEAEPASSAPSPGIMKWHSYLPILWEHFRPSQIVQGFPIHSSLAPIPPGFPSCPVSVWLLSFSRKEIPLAHFGISFMWVSKCLFWFSPKYFIAISPANLQHSVLNSTENKNVMISHFFPSAVQMDTWPRQKDKDVETYKICTEI